MTVVSSDGRFEWDSEKNRINREKHGLSFEEILSVFDDHCFLERYDYMHSDVDEDRMFGIGDVKGVAIISISFTERHRIRIISARLASPKEERIYHEYCRHLDC